MRTIELAYRIEPGAHMAVDENGNGTEAYFKIDMGQCRDNVTDKQIERLHKELANKELFGIEPQYITPITIALLVKSPEYPPAHRAYGQ